MDLLEDQIYKPQVKKWGIYFLGSGLMLLGEVMLIWLLISPKVAFGMKLFLTVFTIVCLFYGIYFFVFPLFTRLKISKTGISYVQPLYSVFCEWKNLSGLRFTKDHLSLSFNEHAIVNENILEKIFVGRKRIPLDLFINKFDKLDIWVQDPVLQELQKHIPNLADEVNRAIN